MFLYYRISLVLSVLALAAWGLAVTVYEAPRYGDGYGPDALYKLHPGRASGGNYLR
ncbi:hypothetical protein [Achromobacter sp.]|uniref:hypothetical protein n=1 Tax=Achromobacter sp. TaxID=134375 RepID=UPI003C75848C